MPNSIHLSLKYAKICQLSYHLLRLTLLELSGYLQFSEFLILGIYRVPKPMHTYIWAFLFMTCQQIEIHSVSLSEKYLDTSYYHSNNWHNAALYTSGDMTNNVAAVQGGLKFQAQSYIWLILKKIDHRFIMIVWNIQLHCLQCWQQLYWSK